MTESLAPLRLNLELKEAAATTAVRGQPAGAGSVAATLRVTDLEEEERVFDFRFRGEELAFHFTAASFEMDVPSRLLRGQGVADGDLQGEFSYVVRYGEPAGLQLSLIGPSGDEIVAAEAGGHDGAARMSLCSGEAREVSLRQADQAQTTCGCQAMVNGTTEFGTRIVADICGLCLLANSLLHLEIDFLGRLLIFDADVFATETCTSTPEGLQITVTGSGTSNICGRMSFTLTLVDQGSLSYQLRSASCSAFESVSTGPFPTVNVCNVTPVRGLAALTTRL